jgi:hypothetical protein
MGRRPHLPHLPGEETSLRPRGRDILRQGPEHGLAEPIRKRPLEVFGEPCACQGLARLHRQNQIGCRAQQRVAGLGAEHGQERAARAVVFPKAAQQPKNRDASRPCRKDRRGVGRSATGCSWSACPRAFSSTTNRLKSWRVASFGAAAINADRSSSIIVRALWAPDTPILKPRAGRSSPRLPGLDEAVGAGARAGGMNLASFRCPAASPACGQVRAR